MRRSSGQDKTGFIFCVHLQWTLLEAVFLAQVNLKIFVSESGCWCKYFSSAILLLSFPCPKLYSSIQQEGGGEERKHPDPHSKPFKMYVAVCKSLKQQQKQKCKGLKQICFQLRRSFTSARNPQQWDPSVQCLIKTSSVVKVMGLWRGSAIQLCPDYAIAQTVVWSSV